jgi:hypothetical protein
MNFEAFDKVKGSPVLYGEVVQLMHVMSKKFLRFDQKNNAEFEADNFA